MTTCSGRLTSRKQNHALLASRLPRKRMLAMAISQPRQQPSRMAVLLLPVEAQMPSLSWIHMQTKSPATSQPGGTQLQLVSPKAILSSQMQRVSEGASSAQMVPTTSMEPLGHFKSFLFPTCQAETLSKTHGRSRGTIVGNRGRQPDLRPVMWLPYPFLNVLANQVSLSMSSTSLRKIKPMTPS